MMGSRVSETGIYAVINRKRVYEIVRPMHELTEQCIYNVTVFRRSSTMTSISHEYARLLNILRLFI